MRVLNVNKYHYLRGGSEQYFFFVERGLRARGHDVVPFAMRHPDNLPSEYERYWPAEVDYFGGSLRARVAAGFKVLYSRDARLCVARLLDDHPADVAHLHLFQQQFSLAILPEIRRRGIPIVHTVHDLKPVCPAYRMLTHDGICERCLGGHFHRCVRHRCVKGSLAGSLVAAVEMYLAHLGGFYRHIDRFVAPSRFYARKLEEGGIPGGKIEVLPLACEVEQTAARYDDDGYALCAGRLSEEKGVATLLQAARIAGSKVPIKIAGTGPLEDSLRRQAADLGLEHVEFVGYQSGARLRELQAGAMFFVVPSEWYENAPVVIHEALSLGKPVVGSRIGGIPELVEDGENGLTFAMGDAAALAEALASLAADPGRRRRLGTAARRRAEARHSPAAHVERLLEIYAECRAGSRRA